MYIAMNRFKVIKEERKAFEDHCRIEGAQQISWHVEAVRHHHDTLSLAQKASGLDEA